MLYTCSRWATTFAQVGRGAPLPGTAHGHFVFETVHDAVVLEEVARMARHTLFMNPDIMVQQELLDCNNLHKQGKNAYYGQN